MNSKKIHKVLIANRGEIAVRIIKTLRKLHIASVAIFADNDASALHRRMADEAYPLGNGALKDTYLNVHKIIDAALDSGSDAIHPGYGFLSESPELAEACEANNLIFIGPDANAMRLMGNKIEARKIAVKNGIPVTFGMMGSHEEILQKADTLPYPVLIKAAAGGGGKGMHIVWEKDDLLNELQRASREAEKYFGDGTVFVEQYIENPRHIEVQVLADHFGNTIHLHKDSDIAVFEYGGNDCDFDWKSVAADPMKFHEPKVTLHRFVQQYKALIDRIKGFGMQPVVLSMPLIDPDRFFEFLSIGLNKDNILSWLGGKTMRIYQWHEMYNVELFKVRRQLAVTHIGTVLHVIGAKQLAIAGVDLGGKVGFGILQLVEGGHGTKDAGGHTDEKQDEERQQASKGNP